MPSDRVSSATLFRTIVREIAFEKLAQAPDYQLVAMTDAESDVAIASIDRAARSFRARPAK